MHDRFLLNSSNEKKWELGNNLPLPFDNFDAIQRRYSPEKYKKLASTLLLRKIGLKVLPGFVIDKLDTGTIHFLAEWAASTKSERLSLRFDSPNKDDNVKLSSLNPTLRELEGIQHLIKPPIIGIVLAENDRYKQNHSVLIQFQEDRMLYEIVGPGFDAADLTRGNVSPHEVIEIAHKDQEVFNMFPELSSQDILKHRIIKPEDYTKSVRLRHGTVYATISKGFGTSVSPQDIDKAGIDQVNKFLEERGATIPISYEPLGASCLSNLYSHLVLLDTFSDYYGKSFGVDVRNKVLSASFLQKHGLVFWDVYDGLKYSSKS